MARRPVWLQEGQTAEGWVCARLRRLGTAPPAPPNTCTFCSPSPAPGEVRDCFCSGEFQGWLAQGPEAESRTPPLTPGEREGTNERVGHTWWPGAGKHHRRKGPPVVPSWTKGSSPDAVWISGFYCSLGESPSLSQPYRFCEMGTITLLLENSQSR